MGEQPLPKNGSCNLCAINLSQYVEQPFQEGSIFDFLSLKQDIEIYVKAMDNLIDENLDRHPLEEQRRIAEKYRNIGIGVMGYADMLIKLRYKYGSTEAIKFTSELFKFLFRESVFSSLRLVTNSDIFQENSEKIAKSDIIWNHFDLNERKTIIKSGLKNASLLSIAPTGSISTMLNVSGGIEPVFAFEHKRRTENISDKEYEVYVDIVKEYFELFPNEKKLPDYFVEAHDINWRERIDTQSVIQYSVDTAISSTINLPEDTTIDDIYELYMYAWEKQLKGITIYRNNSRNNILSRIDNKPIKQELLIKRPSELPVDIHTVKIKGEDWTVLVGLLDNKPYELFTFKNKNVHLSDKIKNAKLIKEVTDKGNKYHLKSDEITIQDLPTWYATGEEEFTTRLISRMMRIGYDLNIIINDAEKTNKSIGTFVNVLKRVLSKYVKTQITIDICPECGNELTREEGCMKCTCGYSKCN